MSDGMLALNRLVRKLERSVPIKVGEIRTVAGIMRERADRVGADNYPHPHELQQIESFVEWLDRAAPPDVDEIIHEEQFEGMIRAVVRDMVLGEHPDLEDLEHYINWTPLVRSIREANYQGADWNDPADGVNGYATDWTGYWYWRKG